jgi:hypothetical protein
VKLKKFPVLITFLLVFRITSGNSSTTIYVDPADIYDPTLVSGTNFSINVSLSNVTNLYGFEFKLAYNPEYLNISDVSIQSFLNSPTSIVKNETDYIDGSVWVSVSSLSPAEPKTGSGTLVIITFNVLDIVIDYEYVSLYDTNLIDNSGNPIPHDVYGGNFNNNPEVSTTTTTVPTTTTTTTSSITTTTSTSTTSSTTTTSTTLPPLQPYAPDMTPIYIIMILGFTIPVVILLLVSREFT